MARTSPPPRAFFCPDCGQAIRPQGANCPECFANVALPPAIALTLHSPADELALVRMQAQAPARYIVPSTWTLLGAGIIDLSLLGALCFPLLLLLRNDIEVLPFAVLGIWAAWEWGFPALFGGSPGMLLMGLRIVDDASGHKPDPIQATLRLLGFGFAILTLGLTLLAALADPQRRGWHDLLAGTRLISLYQRDSL